MLTLFLKTSLKFLVKEQYPKWYILFIELLSSLLMLSTFWFTAKAYTPKGLTQQSYFDYLLIGELCLYLPLLLLFQSVQLMKKSALSSFIDQLIVANKSLISYGGYFLWAYFLKGFLKIVSILLLSALIFEMPFDIENLLLFFGLQIAVFIPAASLGLTIGLFVVFWGRGGNIWGQVSSWLSFLAGAYFPISSFPSWLVDLLPFINPYALYLEVCRKVLSSNSREVLSMNECLGAFFWGLLFLLALFLVYHYGLKAYKRRGPPSSYSA